MRLKEYRRLKNVLDLHSGALRKRGNVSHVISGFRVRMLRKIFEEHGSPLFRHFIPYYLGSLNESDTAKLSITVVEQRDIGVEKESLREAAKTVFPLVGGH